MATTNAPRRTHISRSIIPLTSTISKCILGLIILSWIVCLYLMSSLVGCSQNDLIATPDLLVRSSIVKDATIPAQSTCQAEYNRIVSQQTPGLTPQDLLRSRAYIGNQHRLENVMKSLSSRDHPVVAVVVSHSLYCSCYRFAQILTILSFPGWR